MFTVIICGRVVVLTQEVELWDLLAKADRQAQRFQVFEVRTST